jgi:hypothetical protein
VVGYLVDRSRELHLGAAPLVQQQVDPWLVSEPCLRAIFIAANRDRTWIVGKHPARTAGPQLPRHGRGRSRGERSGGCLAVPRQELMEVLDIVIVDAGENIGEPGLRIDIVELGGF